MQGNSISTIYYKQPRNTLNNLKAKNQILGHTIWQVLYNKQHTAFRSNCKSLFNPLPWNSFSFHHKTKTGSRFSVVRATSKIKIKTTNNVMLKLIRLFIGQHVIIGSLQISKDLLTAFQWPKLGSLEYLPKAFTTKTISRWIQT